MVSLDKKGRMNIWEKFEEVIDEGTFKNELQTTWRDQINIYIMGFKGYISEIVWINILNTD